MSFHAHPDDESVLTGGTLASLAATGHRVVVVTATAGERGLTGSDVASAALASHRLTELDEAAHRLGVARVVCLGYPDSGYGARPPAFDSFSRTPVIVAAARLAGILDEEAADVLTIYDERGGYGHIDHVQVHRVGLAAARQAGTRRVLQATVERERVLRLSRVMRVVPGLPPEVRPQVVRASYAPRSVITHCLDVTAQLDAKRAAMAAHESQRGGGRRPRSFDLFLRMPPALFARTFGREWFIEFGRSPRRWPATDFWCEA